MDPRSGLPTGRFPLALRAVQAGLALFLLTLAVVGSESNTFYAYYGLAIAVVPSLVDYVSGGRLTELHRAYLVTGLSLHPLGFALNIYYVHQWWDILTHFVSGTMLAAGIYALVIGSREGTDLPQLQGWRLHAFVFGLMLSFALVWEVYEIWDAHWRIYAYVDSVTDVVMGLTGWAVVGATYPHVLGEIPSGITPRLERAWALFSDHFSRRPRILE